MRSIQDVGAHRRRNHGKPSVEYELWKRTVWILFGADLMICSSLGRQSASSFDEYVYQPCSFSSICWVYISLDLEIPAECDDEYWENANPELAFKQPPGQPSKVAFCVVQLKLLQIIDHAQRTIVRFTYIRLARLLIWWSSTQYSIKKSDHSRNDTEIVTKLDSELNQWIDSLPEHRACLILIWIVVGIAKYSQNQFVGIQSKKIPFFSTSQRHSMLFTTMHKF